MNRKRAHDPDDIERWYEMFKKVCEEYGIKLEDIWNVDKTGFMIGVGKDQWVLIRDGAWPSYIGSTTNQELVTVIESVSAGGRVIQPMVILPGKVHQEHWYTKTGLDNNVLVAVSKSGYTNDHLAL